MFSPHYDFVIFFLSFLMFFLWFTFFGLIHFHPIISFVWDVHWRRETSTLAVEENTIHYNCTENTINEMCLVQKKKM